MKTLIVGLGLVVVGIGLWFGWTRWRANRQLVTLHVRNSHLADVLGKIEWQTRAKIRAEKALDARITLNVTGKPLAYVMDRIAEQAGARWSTLYAVYDSTKALGKLEAALGSDGMLEPAGWMKIAPNPLTLDLKGPNGFGELDVDKFDPSSAGSDAKLPPGVIVKTTDDVVVRRGSDGLSDAGHSMQKGAGGPMVVRVVRKGGVGSGDATEQEVWTPEELVIESGLNTKLGNDRSDAATPEAAKETAQKVGGKWATYYALRKSSLGMEFGGFQLGTPRFRPLTLDTGPNGPGATKQGAVEMSGPSPADLAEVASRQKNNEFGRLTPQQRVARARDRARFKNDGAR